MPTFEVKQVQVPLFGVVDAPDQTAWYTAFSAATTATQIQVDSTALDIIAEDLELDAEGLATDAERYVNGNYRAKARGMGGSRLGDLGEILAFLVNRASGQNIMRVVSWRQGSVQAIKGSRFPQPDFIIQNRNGLAALEVKSTEAFDFVDLRDGVNNWTWLQPCSSVGGCREQALPQLAFVGGQLTPQQHSLVISGGTVVPFPVGKGIAAAVIAVDGRINALRNEAKYKTPKTCRESNRNCWSCLPENCHFVLVTMPNAPGMLSLGGSAGNGSTKWFYAYQRWAQALASRDLLAVRSSVGDLAEAVASWLDTGDAMDTSDRGVLRSFWGSYFGDAMRSRGINVDTPAQFGDLSRAGMNFEWTAAPLAEPASREASIEDIMRFLSQAHESATPFLMSAFYRPNAPYPNSMTVEGNREFVEFRLVSETWWKQEKVENIQHASLIAKSLLSLALKLTDWPSDDGEFDVLLRKVVAKVGENNVLVGWESKPVSPHSIRSMTRYWRFWFHFELWQPWPVLLALGDSRVRLRVTPDGRANLRVLRTLLRHP